MFVLDDKQSLFIQQCKDVLVNITRVNILFVFAIVWTDSAPDLRVQLSFHETKPSSHGSAAPEGGPLAVTHGATR